MQETGCPWHGLETHMSQLSGCVFWSKNPFWMGYTVQKWGVLRQLMIIFLDEHGTRLWGVVFHPRLLVLPALGRIPTALPAKRATWESLNSLRTRPAEFLKDPKACARPDDSPEVGQGALCTAPFSSSMVGMVSQQPPADGQEAEALVFQTVQPKSLKDVHPQHAISLKCASATFDNSCTFSKVSLISKTLHNWLFWSTI